ncbi:hypothetical protein BKA69DRAFT_1051609 [Paraphysoderma sedebokerense]|nr:hypothetical protein BKA69DRAFT_1051609 [Paraphysoderma sedebokerense]
MNSLKSSASSSPTSSDPPTPPEQDFYQIYQLRYFNSYIHYLSVSHLLVSTKEYHQGYRNSIIRHEFRKSLQLLPHLFLTPFKLLSLLTLPIHYYSSFRIFYCPQPFKGAITLPRIYGRELATISKSVLNVWDIQWLFISSSLCFCLVLMNDVSMVLALVYSISSRLLFSTACRIGRVSSVLEKLLTLVSSSISKLLALELTALPISYFYQSSVTGAILRWTTWMSATSNGWLPFEAHIYKFVEHYFGLWQPGLAGRWLCYCMWFWVSVTVQQHYTYFKSRILSS